MLRPAAVAFVLLLAGCSSSADPTALLGSLEGEVACRADPKLEDGLASCQTVAGDGIVASHRDEDPGPLFALALDSGDGIYVWHPGDRISVLAPNEPVAAEIAEQTGGDVVTQAYFEREFLGR